MLRILDRYVIREVLAPFALALALFTFILLVDPLMKEAQRLIEKGVGAVDHPADPGDADAAGARASRSRSRSWSGC